MANKSVEDFHQKVVESLRLFQSCLSEKSLRSCVYNTSLSNAMPVNRNKYKKRDVTLDARNITDYKYYSLTSF